MNPMESQPVTTASLHSPLPSQPTSITATAPSLPKSIPSATLPTQPRSLLGYSISILQYPTRARMCGVTTPIGKRILDPALVVAINFDTLESEGDGDEQGSTGPSRTPSPAPQSGTAPYLKNMSRAKQASIRHRQLTAERLVMQDQFVCLVSLCDAESGTPIGYCESSRPNLSSEKEKYAELLTGKTVTTTQYLTVSPGVKKHIFVFTDLSVRLNGVFVIKAMCVNLATYVSCYIES